MVIILGLSKKFISIRWKLVSTYLLLIILTLLLINSFISEAIRMNYVNEKKITLLTQGTIIADRIGPYSANWNETNDNDLRIIIKKYSKDMEARILVINTNHVVISDSYDVFKGNRLTHYEVEEALRGESIAKEHQLIKYGRTLYIGVPITYENGVNGVVFISSSLESIYAKINAIMRNYLFLSLLSIGITGVISFIFAHVIATPMEKLTESITKMYQGNLEQKVEVTGNDELSNLGSAFNMMSTKLALVDKQRKDFVANVSHELKTPLSAVKLLSESLLHQDKAEIETYREFLKDIDSEVDRLNKIIESLLDLVDIDKGKLELDYQVTYVNYLIEKLISSLKPIADNKNIKVVFADLEKIQIQLDQIKIQQALTNIIHNAIKYTPNGGNIVISLYSEYDEIIIKIQDNGMGIPEESLPYIFEKFYRVDKARSRSTGGSGLGLAISQQIVGLHQGKIVVNSQVGKGTTFYVYLPKSIGLSS